MSVVRGTYTNGKVILNTPADWPEGTKVLVEPVAEAAGIGLPEEDWPTDPERIASLAAEMGQIQPFLAPEEDEAWRKALAERKAFELANWDKWAKETGELFR
ncbi:MAG: hypothetical protein JWO38_968 [Gemmataceae bacterium]|nr:hypothetical protein [Gemmataceae bacterium]